MRSPDIEVLRDEKAKKIREVIASHPQGVSFNQLNRETKRFCARQTLANKLKFLVETGLIQRVRVGKQRIVYTDTELSRRLSDATRLIEDETESFRTLIALEEYYFCEDETDPEETLKNTLDYLRMIILFIVMRGAEESSKLKGRSRELILIEVMNACRAVLTEFYGVISNNPKLRSALIKRASKGYSLYYNDVKRRMSTNWVKLKADVEDIKDPKLRSRMKKVIKRIEGNLAS